MSTSDILFLLLGVLCALIVECVTSFAQRFSIR